MKIWPNFMNFQELINSGEWKEFGAMKKTKEPIWNDYVFHDDRCEKEESDKKYENSYNDKKSANLL